MARLKLEVDALRVETFDTAGALPGRGTVHARGDEAGGEQDDRALIPVTDWRTCQGGDCTARTLCQYSCIEACVQPGGPVVATAIGD